MRELPLLERVGFSPLRLKKLVVCRSMEMVNTEDFPAAFLLSRILYLDEDPYPNAIYSHEQMEYTAES